MRSSLMRARWAAVGAAVAVTLGGGAVMVVNAATASDAGEFRALAEPCRILDTRTVTTSQILPTGMYYDRVGNASSLPQFNDLTIIFDKDAKSGGANSVFTYDPTGTPAARALMGGCDALWANGGELDTTHSIQSVLLNVSAVDMTADSFITVYPWTTLVGPSGIDPDLRPLYSNLNPIDVLPVVQNQVAVSLSEIGSGVEIPNVKCATGTHGDSDCGGYDAFRIYNNAGTVHIVVDVLGYFYN